jgi:hypothetical protein
VPSAENSTTKVLETLASINHRTSERNSTVSPHCVTAFLPPTDGALEFNTHNFPKGAPLVTVPFILGQLDLTYFTLQMFHSMQSKVPDAGPPRRETSIDFSAINLLAPKDRKE